MKNKIVKKKILIAMAALIIAFGIAGCKEDNEPVQKKLKITGIPSDITAGAILDETGLVSQKPVATGLNISGVITLCEPADGKIPMPDANKPWKGSGSYYIGLTKANLTTFTVEENYVYTDGKEVDLGIDTTGFMIAFSAAYLKADQDTKDMIAGLLDDEDYFENNPEKLVDFMAFVAPVLAGSMTSNIQKYEIQNEETVIPFDKFKLIDESVLSDQLLEIVQDFIP